MQTEEGTFDNFFLGRSTPPGGRSQVDDFKAHLGAILRM